MKFKVLIALSVLAIFISCASTSKQLSRVPDSKLVQKNNSVGNIECNTVNEPISSINSQELSIDEKIALAEYLCSELRFNEADSLLREILSTIDYENEVDTGGFPVDDYIETIIKVYTLMMPQEYIPEDIAILQFRHQMLQSLDSVSSTPEDSILINKLTNQNNFIYDVPMVWNNRVKKALEYYLRKPEAISRLLSRASVYLPKMKKMFADSGLPQDLAYLPLIESGFNALAYSRAHASGIWQFISSTGKSYGLRHNYWLDERRDPIKSTKSAICYLKKLYGDFGNWHLALAAYNCGEGGVARAIARSGTNDYWQLPLPAETKNYVPCYLAALTIAKNPNLFNFTFSKSDTFAYDTVMINDCIDMKNIAQGISLSYDTLRKINPQILHWCTPPDVSNVSIYLPADCTQAFKDFYSQMPEDLKVKWYSYKVRKHEKVQTIARRFKVPVDAIREMNHLGKSNRITSGQLIIIPIPVNSSTIESVDIDNERAVKENLKRNKNSLEKPVNSTDQKTSKICYKVKKGDTISEIANLFDVSEDEIKDWNNLKASNIIAGQSLTIHTGKSKNSSSTLDSYKVQEGDSPYSIAKKFNISINQLVRWNDLDIKSPVVKIDQVLTINGQSAPVKKSQTKLTKVAVDTKYIVSPGDNIFRIAQNFSISMDELLEANDLSENSTIHAGDILFIPRLETKLKQQKSAENFVYYYVKQGDTLWNIATNFGISVQSLYKINNFNSDTVLMPGDTIKVVKAGKM